MNLLLKAKFKKDKIYVKHKSFKPLYVGMQIPYWYRKKAIFGLIRKELKDVFHRLAQQKDCKIEEGYLMRDHIHMLISIPPKHSVSTIVGFIKGKSSIWVAQNISNKQRNFVGHKFWARGYFVSTVGVNEEVIRKYVQNQEYDDQRIEQL